MTARIAIGTAVVNPFTRHPALIAMETATLAGIAPGRVVLGLGTGVRRWIADQMRHPGAAPARHARRVRRRHPPPLGRRARDARGPGLLARRRRARVQAGAARAAHRPRRQGPAGARRSRARWPTASCARSCPPPPTCAGCARRSRRRAGNPGAAPAPCSPTCPSRSAVTAPPRAAPCGRSSPATSRISTARRSWPRPASRSPRRSRSARRERAARRERPSSPRTRSTPSRSPALPITRGGGSTAWIEAGLDTPIALPVGEADPVEQLRLIATELLPSLVARP